jgi:hypothetical protein
MMLRAIGLVMPFMRELPEMAYQWEVPFVIDDAKFRARFGTAPTPLAEQIATTAAWARRTYGATNRQKAGDIVPEACRS